MSCFMMKNMINWNVIHKEYFWSFPKQYHNKVWFPQQMEILQESEWSRTARGIPYPYRVLENRQTEESGNGGEFELRLIFFLKLQSGHSNDMLI